MRLLYIDPIEVREAPVLVPSLPEGDEEGTRVLPPEVDEPPAPEDAPPEPEPAAEPEQSPTGLPGPAFGQIATADAPEPEDEELEEPAPRFDIRTRQTQVTLAVVGAMVLAGVVVLVLLFAGY